VNSNMMGLPAAAAAAALMVLLLGAAAQTAMGWSQQQ
jgi:hypothetical protein